MTKSIDFYFDFISPYSYLAYKKIENLSEININYKPILLGGLHKLGGITAPAFNERKMKNMKNDCELVAKKNNIQFKWNTKFPINSLTLMRGYLIVEPKFTKIDEIDFFKKISLEKVKENLKELTNTAFKNDIFGAPTFVVNSKMFWGQDRLDYALDEYHS